MCRSFGVVFGLYGRFFGVLSRSFWRSRLVAGAGRTVDPFFFQFSLWDLWLRLQLHIILTSVGNLLRQPPGTGEQGGPVFDTEQGFVS